MAFVGRLCGLSDNYARGNGGKVFPSLWLRVSQAWNECILITLSKSTLPTFARFSRKQANATRSTQPEQNVGKRSPKLAERKVDKSSQKQLKAGKSGQKRPKWPKVAKAAAKAAKSGQRRAKTAQNGKPGLKCGVWSQGQPGPTGAPKWE